MKAKFKDSYNRFVKQQMDGLDRFGACLWELEDSRRAVQCRLDKGTNSACVILFYPDNKGYGIFTDEELVGFYGELKTQESQSSSLNAEEIKVLGAVIMSHNCSGGEFTYFSEVLKLLSMKENSLKGYISQLVQKDYICVCEELEQINVTKRALEIFPGMDALIEIF